MRSDIILEFCNGKRPKDLISQNIASKKTVYYYHSIFNEMKEFVQSDEFANELVKLIVKLRMKEQKKEE